MNKPNSPWSIKGVSPEARDAAKEGARISRQPLGRWLSQVIRMTSVAEGAAPTAPTGSAEPASTIATASPTSAATWQEAVVRLEARIAETERHATAAVQPVDEALQRIADRLESIETFVLRRTPRSYLGRLLRR
jgi:localization factor PodJL